MARRARPVWTAEGPGCITGGGSVVTPNNAEIGAIKQEVVADPSNPDILYVAAINGGIWKTTNATDPNGPTWFPLTDNMPSLSIGTVAMDPGANQPIRR